MQEQTETFRVNATSVMAERIRNFDWSRTSLGAIDEWEPSLRTAVELMLNCAFPATLQWGRDLVLLYNDPYIPLIGSRHPAALGKPILNTFPEIAETYGPLAAQVREGATVSLRNQFFRYVRDDEPVDSWFDLSYSPVFDEARNVGGILAIGLETTEKVQAERLLRESDERQAFMLRLSDELRTIRDPVETQSLTAHLLGSQLKVHRAHYAEVVKDDFVIRCEYVDGVPSIVGNVPVRSFGKEIPEALERGESVVIDDVVRYSGADRSMREAFVSVSVGAFMAAPLIKEGRWVAALAVHSATPRQWEPRELELLKEVAERTWADVERARAEHALEESERYFRALVNSTADVVFRMNADWTEMRQLRGSGFLHDTNLADRDWLQRYIYSEDRAKVLAGIQTAMEAKTAFHLEHRVLQADETVEWMFTRAVPVLNEKGEIAEWFGAASNITMRKRAEAALRENEKLAVVGRLATSIAHEINNPLEAVTNLIYLAEVSEPPPEIKRYLGQAQVELKRVNEITAETLRFHRQNSHASESDLKEIIESVVKLHEPRLRNAQVAVHRRYKTNLPLYCFPNEIRQVIANLLGNSIDAMATESRRDLCIRVEDARSHADGRTGVRFTIADTGAGMSRTTMERIFEPFFTTKELTGTGLGLWITQEIVRKHDGVVRVRSRQAAGRSGTTFSVFLPHRFHGASEE